MTTAAASASVDIATLRAERLARLRQFMAAEDVAAAVFFDPINIRYATDVSNMQVWSLHNPVRYSFIPASGPVVHFEFASCSHLAEGFDLIDEVRPAVNWCYMMSGQDAGEAVQTWAAEIADLVSRHGGGNRRVAVDRLDLAGFLALKQMGMEALDGHTLAEKARTIKTPQELNAMRASIEACEQSCLVMGEAMTPGMTEQELWSVLHQQNIARGGEWIETRLLTSGPRTNPWYNECSDRVIEDGDLVAFDTDLIGRYGYCCDISRTWRMGGGEADDEQRRTYAHAHAHLEKLKRLVRPGLETKDLAAEIGNRPNAWHVYSCLLHGVGMCDEYPTAMWFDQLGHYNAVIEPGMTLCLEAYSGPVEGREGVKLEDQVLVTDDGIEVLSTLPFEEDWL